MTVQTSEISFSYLKNDVALYNVIAKLGPLAPRVYPDPFIHLLRTVAGQQLSVRVATGIFEKFTQHLPAPSPKNVLAMEVESLRSMGFSYGKAGYIHNIAQFWLDNKIDKNILDQMNDEEIISLLTQIKGVGRWSVEILLAFSLGRENVFFVDDLGIQQGMALIYGWDVKDKKELRKLMIEKSKTFAPHSTQVCLYIWQWKNQLRAEQKKI